MTPTAYLVSTVKEIINFLARKNVTPAASRTGDCRSGARKSFLENACILKKYIYNIVCKGDVFMYRKYKTNKELKKVLGAYERFIQFNGFYPNDDYWRAMLAEQLNFDFLTFNECIRLEQFSVVRSV